MKRKTPAIKIHQHHSWFHFFMPSLLHLLPPCRPLMWGFLPVSHLHSFQSPTVTTTHFHSFESGRSEASLWLNWHFLRTNVSLTENIMAAVEAVEAVEAVFIVKGCTLLFGLVGRCSCRVFCNSPSQLMGLSADMKQCWTHVADPHALVAMLCPI